MLSDICTIARDAGAAILRYYKSGDLSVDEKVDGTPVTAADREADGQIRTHQAN